MAKEVILNLDLDVLMMDLAELCGRPSPEEEFAMEKSVLDIKETKDIEKVKDYAIAFARQTHHQSHFIATCLERIALTEAKLISREQKVRQKKTIFQKLSMINAILFGKEKDS